MAARVAREQGRPLRTAWRCRHVADRSRNRCVKTVAKLNPATCQNQTLVSRKPTPKASSPANEAVRAARAIAQACQ